MKYLKYFLKLLKKQLIYALCVFYPVLIILGCFVLSVITEGYTSEDLGFNINPNDYCNLTDVDYTAVVQDELGGKASVEITEYLTFDVHASSISNKYKELWRELPEDNVDGLDVTYDVYSVSQILDDGTEIPYKQAYKMYWEDYDYTESSTMRWHHSSGSGRYPDNDESLLIYIPWTYRDKLTFKIVYRMNNAVLKYNDCSELYLSMYSGNTIKKLNSYKAQILVPNELMPTSYYAYTFGTRNSKIPYSESDTINSGYHTFSINLDKSDLKFDYHNRYIEFCLLSYGNDRHIFSKFAPYNLYSGDNVLEECISENEYYENQNKLYDKYKKILLTSSILISVLIIVSTKKKYSKAKEKNNLCNPEIDFEFFREIPSNLDPLFASELVFMKDPFDENKEKKEEYAAILLSLVRKQYVKIVKVDSSADWSNYNTLITLEPLFSKVQDSENVSDYSTGNYYVTANLNTGKELEPLSTSERLYYDLLERHTRKTNNKITLAHLQTNINEDYIYTNSFVKDIEKKPALECGVAEGYFQETNYDKIKNKFIASAKSSLTLGLLILIFGNLISYFTPLVFAFGAYTILGIALLWRYFYLTIKSSDLILFTQFGKDEQAKWCGLYNFLNSDTLINEKEVHDLPLWEKYLIYATAFGISEKVIKAIKIHAVELNIDNSPILNHHCYIHSSNFHSTSRSFGNSMHTVSRGGGRFAGHGYGGGGRGG